MRVNAKVASVILAVSVLVLASPVLAGSLDFIVSSVKLSTTHTNPTLALTLSYNLAGSGFNVPGGLQRVKVDFLSGQTVTKSVTIYPGDPGARRGANAIFFAGPDLPAPGAYTVRVSAFGVGITAPEYVTVSNSSDPNLQFAAGRGVDVNRVAGSPYLGRIYVTEGAGGGTANRSTVDGVYVLNPDQSPAFAQPKATSALIGALGPWGTSANSPNRLVVDGEGKVYITDVSDPHSGVFVADPDVNSISPLFVYPYPSGGSRDPSGLVKDSAGYSLYGSTSSIWVEGTGASRTVYTTDEDVAPGNSMWKRQIPEGTTNSAVRPTLIASPSGANWAADLVRDSAGNTYAVSLTTGDARKYDSTGAVVSSLPSIGAGYYGVCINEPLSTILLATNDGRILKTDAGFAGSSVIWDGVGAEVRDVAMDADGWIYELNGTDKRLDILAVGDFTTNDATATAAETLNVEPTPVPGDIAPVGPEGRNTGPNGLLYGDGIVDMRDAIYAIQMAVGAGIKP